MWSVIEPSYQTFNWTVIDRVLDLMKEEGSMRAIIGTPTATPPKWLIDAEGGDNTSSLILPWSIENQVRTFGSRRHYKFSSDVYLKHGRRIVEQIARRYGNHPVVAGFQLDNEYGCHSTVRSYDRGDTLSKFRGWLKRRYGNDVRFLNERWGNSFWSMEYKSFEEIDLPNLTVTEANPSHWLAFYRFSSDLVAEYSDSQTQVLRQYVNSDKFITTNFMGMFWDMDHFDLTEKSNLDIASWDSYPLGFTDSFHVFTNEEKIMYAKTGHPDISAFHHDLYSGVTGRGMKRDQFIVMEQQPGPVNWASYNPSPHLGMVRLWTWEAFSHGSNLVSYFRWRQAPFAQEQMHSGLNRVDNSPDVAYNEAAQVFQELQKLPEGALANPPQRAPIALLLSYPSSWALSIQPQGSDFTYDSIVFNFYTVLRSLGLDIDILRPGADLTGYRAVFVPTLPIAEESNTAIESLEKYVLQNKDVALVVGPRTGSKTSDLTFSTPLPPGTRLQKLLLPFCVDRVESFRPGSPLSDRVSYSGVQYKLNVWKEWLRVLPDRENVSIKATFSDGMKLPALLETKIVNTSSTVQYLAFWPSQDFLMAYLADVLNTISVPNKKLPTGIRMRNRGEVTFLFNYRDTHIDVKDLLPPKYQILVGESTTTDMKPHSVLAFRKL